MKKKFEILIVAVILTSLLSGLVIVNNSHNKAYEPTSLLQNNGTNNMLNTTEMSIFQNAVEEEAVTLDISLIISYTIKNGKLILEQKPVLKNKVYIDYQNNVAIHEKILKLIKSIIPSKYFKLIQHLEITTDGKGNMEALVTQTNVEKDKWLITIDIADALNDEGLFDEKKIVGVLIHEFAHILTLNNTQVEHREANNDDKTLIMDVGVAKEISYLNQFYNQFWVDIYDRFNEIKQLKDQDKLYIELEQFNKKYRSRFVNEYAQSDITEDIAETFRLFVLEEKPQGKTVVEEKILFFYSFKELVQMREDIRKALALK